MKRTLVVGAGAIGLASAYALRNRGREVTVVDRGPPGDACTKGNAGWITPSISSPVPAPGLTLTSIKWMLRSDSPLYISPTAAPGLARWLWRFWRYCNPRDFISGLNAVADLNRRTLPLFDRLEKDGVPIELHKDGLLFVFRGREYMEKVRHEFDHYKAYGYSVPKPMDGAELRELEPALAESVTTGFLVPEEYHVRPETLARGYVDKLATMGVEIRTGVDVQGIARRNGKIGAVETSQGPIEADEVLIAAGAWSGQVAEKFGVKLPVQAGKGYSITIDEGGPAFNRPIYLGEAKVGCSPFAGSVRFAGTMELSGINTVLDRRRVVGIRKGVGEYLRTPLGPDQGTEWVGMRPLTPDGLPMLGRLPSHDNVFVATGHAMLGITMAPVTGETMADYMTGTLASSALAPFEPGRFRW
jgi:D-amino-acid dehydrogenase